MHTAGRIVIAVPLIAMLGWATIQVAGIDRADAIVTEAAVEMGTWAATRTQPSLGTWTSVHDKLEAARRIDPGDPTASELLGLLASQRSDNPDELDAAVDHLVRALARRPVSPYTWANLVEARYRRGEPGRNMELAI